VLDQQFIIFQSIVKPSLQKWHIVLFIDFNAIFRIFFEKDLVLI